MNVIYYSIYIAIFIFSDVCCQCRWNIKNDIPKNNPIYLTQKHELFYPNSKDIILNRGQSIIADCNGNGNSVYLARHNPVNITCDSGLSVKVDGISRYINELNCTKKVKSDVKTTEKTCGGGRIGQVLSIGFDTTYGWKELFSICYNFKNYTPLYSIHELHGCAVNGSLTNNNRPSFRSSGLPFSWDKIYKNASSFDKGHLAPNADFVFHSMQLATYFYINTVPQYSNLNRGKWQTIEKAVRRAANTYQKNFTIVTGSYDVLNLKYSEIYLGPNKTVPVPKYIWKVVCTADKVCISFVILNNPNEKENNLCIDICNYTNWSEPLNKNNVKRDLVICCEVNELKKTIHFIPIQNVKGILNYVKK